MFNWLKGRNQQPKTEDVIAGSLKAVSKLGELMEKYPGSILDSAMLPLPKPEMKLALKVLWKTSADQKQRDMLEVGYLHLSNFQDGVGKTPINMALPATFDPKQVAASLKVSMSWMNKSTAEMEELHRELQALKKL